MLMDTLGLSALLAMPAVLRKPKNLASILPLSSANLAQSFKMCLHKLLAQIAAISQPCKRCSIEIAAVL